MFDAIGWTAGMYSWKCFLVTQVRITNNQKKMVVGFALK